MYLKMNGERSRSRSILRWSHGQGDFTAFRPIRRSVRGLCGPEGWARVTEQELIDFCRNRIAIYKAPRFVEFVDSRPRNPAGKIPKRELRAREQKTTEPSSLASAPESR